MGARMDLVVLSRTPTTELCAPGRVVKHSDAAAVIGSAALLQRLHEQEAGLHARVAQALAEARERGAEEGRARGHAELAMALARAERARHTLLQSLAPTLAELVTQAVGQLLREASPAQHLRAALQSVQSLLCQARFARWFVAPDQLGTAQAALASLGAEARIVTVHADPALVGDTCRFETDHGTAVAALPVQLQALQQSLEAALSAVLTERAA